MTVQECRCTEDEILAYVSGELDVDAELSVAEHLGECEECCEQAAEFRALDLALPDCCRRDAIRWHGFETPFGPTFVAASDDGLVRVTWGARSAERFEAEMRNRYPARPLVHDPEAMAEAERELREYFAGKRSRFELPVDLSALTRFQRAVLEETSALGFGQVVPYAELARRIGRPKAARAVGNALGSNPVAIVVPCHRVVRSDGTLGGYGGGIHFKERLLEIEGREDLLEKAG